MFKLLLLFLKSPYVFFGTKYSNVYLRKKSGREVSGRLKNAVSNISKKINSGNISYKNDKDKNYPGSFLKTSKLIIKK